MFHISDRLFCIRIASVFGKEQGTLQHIDIKKIRGLISYVKM